MKVIVKMENEKLEKPFPKLMIHKDGTIVYFNAPNTGMTLSPGGLSSHGYISEDFNMTHFTDFTGSITLSNDD